MTWGRGTCGDHAVPVKVLHVHEAQGIREPFDTLFLKGRRTEIDDLNGYVCRQGRTVAVKTPFNDAVVEAFHRHLVGALRPDPKNLEPLVRLLPR